MEFITVAVIYLGGIGSFLFIMLFGESQMFMGTPVARAHQFITFDLCNIFSWCVTKAFGKYGEACVSAADEYCCGKPNPMLQLFYLACIFGGYYVFAEQCYPFLPGPFLSEVHRYTAPAAVLLGLACFYLTSFSDPGYVTAENTEAYQRAYPYDDVLYGAKECATCGVQRPARAKHCRICRRCVGRFDHHCAWMNNCIGERNIAYFIGFLGLHFVICVYGVYLLSAILLGELLMRNVLTTKFRSRSGEPVYATDDPVIFIQWIVTFFPMHLTLLVFLLIIALSMLAFGGFHLYLIAHNTTTNETYKWKDLQYDLIDQAIARQNAEASADAAAPSAAVRPSGGRAGCCGFGAPPLPKVQLPRNIYHKGSFKRNMVEVLWPRSKHMAPKRD